MLRALIGGIVLSTALLVSLPAAFVSGQDGQADLEKATDLKLEAASIRDLEQVIRLTESAIEAGLDDDSRKFADQLLSGTLIEVAQRYAESILNPGQADPRWPFLRQQAVIRLGKALEISADNAAAQLLRARLLALPGGDPAKARQSLDKAMELYADDKPQLSLCHVVAATLAENDEQRLAALNQAIEIAPENVDALRMRAILHVGADRRDEAIADFKRLAELDPSDVMALQAQAEILANGQDFEQALATIEAAIAADPKAVPNYLIRARIRVLQEQLDEAIDDLTLALELQPDELQGLLMRAELLIQKDRFEEARADVEKALAVRPGLIRAILLRSLISAGEEKFGAAAVDLELLVANDPENLPWKLQLALMYAADERSSKAVEVYDQVLEKDPKNFFALRGKADAMLSVGNHEAAITYYDDCLEIEPEDDHILNNLAWVLATSPRDEVRDGARAVELALKACELTKYEEGHILSTLAAGYAETGNFEKAIEFSKKAIERARDDENRASLQKELESYEAGKPFREEQSESEKQPDRRGGTLDF